MKFNYVSPTALVMPDYVKSSVASSGLEQMETEDLLSVIPESDILYVTRIQKERFSTPEEYKKYHGVYVIDKSTLKSAKKTLGILHPLPRVGEILDEVDDDPRAAYFREMKNGMLVRMALLWLVLGAR